MLIWCFCWHLLLFGLWYLCCLVWTWRGRGWSWSKCTSTSVPWRWATVSTGSSICSPIRPSRPPLPPIFTRTEDPQPRPDLTLSRSHLSPEANPMSAMHPQVNLHHIKPFICFPIIALSLHNTKFYTVFLFFDCFSETDILILLRVPLQFWG